MLKKIVLSASFFVASSLYAADEVQLIEAEAFKQSGCYGCTQFDGTVEVANLAADKIINVIYTLKDGVEKSVSASYVGTDINGREKWSFFHQIPAWEGEPKNFTVEYFTNEKKYVDNNNGHGYGIVLNDRVYGETDYVELKALHKFSTGSGCPGCETVSGAIIVENLAFDKKVSIHYTAHNGFQDEIKAKYSANLGNNKELWVFEEVFASSRPKVAKFEVAYQVDGTMYGDSNNEFLYGNKPFWINAYYGNSSNTIGSANIEALRQLGCYGCRQIKGSVNVKNIDLHKSVTVSYVLENGEIKNIAASYQAGTFADGYETWSFKGSDFIAPWDSQPVSAVVTYEVAGRTYSQAFPIRFASN